MSEQLLTTEQLNRAATNSPADEFMLGDRIFQIVDLPYDDYVTYLSYIGPVVKAVATRMILAKTGGVELPGGVTVDESSFSGFDFLTVCGSNIPEMAWITCKQTDPTITIDEVKRLGKKPLVLAQIVLKQIVQNGMISDFKDFFAQGISILKALR